MEPQPTAPSWNNNFDNALEEARSAISRLELGKEGIGVGFIDAVTLQALAT